MAIIAGVCCEEDKLKRKNRKMRMKKWRQNKDEFSNTRVLKELKLRQPDDFKNYMRMDEETFEFLLDKVEPFFPINVETRLSITLRFLATGNSYEDLKLSNAVSAESIDKIVIETCDAICKVLKHLIKVSFFKSKLFFINCSVYKIS